MRHLTIVILGLLASIYMYAQEVEVSVCRLSASDTIPSLPARYDINNDISARVDILCDKLAEVEVRGNVVGNIINYEGRLIVYLCDGTRKIHLYSAGNLPLEIDFTTYPDTKYGVKGGEIYALSVSVPPSESSLPDYGIGSKMLLFESDIPLDKLVVNGEKWNVSGKFAKKLVPYGEYGYEAYSSSNEKISGTVKVDNSLGNKRVKLKFKK